jgi:hypothetical protein
MQFDDQVPRLDFTTVLQPDRTALMTPYLDTEDAVPAQRLDTESNCVNFVYDGQQGPYNSH